MSHKNLHELAKFGAGLVAADFISIWWLTSHSLLPISFLGVMFTTDMVLPALVFDAALFLILVHYGWHIGKVPALRERSYLMIVGIIFALIAAAHLTRVFFGMDLVLMNWMVPHWLSWTAVIVTGYLSYMSFRLATRMKR